MPDYEKLFYKHAARKLAKLGGEAMADALALEARGVDAAGARQYASKLSALLAGLQANTDSGSKQPVRVGARMTIPEICDALPELARLDPTAVGILARITSSDEYGHHPWAVPFRGLVTQWLNSHAWHRDAVPLANRVVDSIKEL